MDWNQLTALPWFWQPFHSLTFALIAVPLVPALLAFIIGVAMFKRRVGGTYFAIITQAIAAILTILIIGQQGYTGGVNGITDLRTLQGWDIRTDHAKVILYFVNGGLLIACLLLAQYVRRSKLGRILVAMRDKEDRVRFSGYDVASFKVFVFCFAAALAGIGGAMFTLQIGFMSPSFVGIVPSIELVIACAVGGRTSLLGAVYGTLLVNFAKTTFSEDMPQVWLLAMGGLFIGVVMLFPDGLAGVWREYLDKYIDRLPGFARGKTPAPKAPAPPALPVANLELGHGQ
jgi:urea transport system permease protein